MDRPLTCTWQKCGSQAGGSQGGGAGGFFFLRAFRTSPNNGCPVVGIMRHAKQVFPACSSHNTDRSQQSSVEGLWGRGRKGDREQEMQLWGRREAGAGKSAEDSSEKQRDE